ncbi:hypothetical protein [Nocardiopsis sp. JB363]|uniref:hypothetical protein n=1 Tax=Nocardiopsis sp. JB363 TaxID=1434837 RepID=UPI00097B809A|nr:hypothetical protein [Nocardiopsis sp. JB363]SIO91419.1 hypothetical protein BQ8420_31635 [Nocardiopsis sp. JB363]
MSVPTMGLHEGDPRQLGGFRLLGRLRESRLGVVYLGRDGAGERVSVAMLNDAAGIDEPTRARFAREVDLGERVVAARTKGRSALWVACPYEEGAGEDAGAFLERAGRGGPVVRSGPMVMPHWAGERGVSAVRWSALAGGRDSKVARGEANWWLIGALGALLLLLLVLVFSLYLWLMQFPQPEPPSQGEQEQSEESDQEQEPSPGEEDEEPSPVPTLPGPGQDGEEEWGEQPEDNL